MSGLSELDLLPDVDSEEEDTGILSANKNVRSSFQSPSAKTKLRSPRPEGLISRTGLNLFKCASNRRNVVLFTKSSDKQAEPWFNNTAFMTDSMSVEQFDAVTHNPRTKSGSPSIQTAPDERTFYVNDPVILEPKGKNREESVVLAIINVLILPEQLKLSLKLANGVYACVYSSFEGEIKFLSTSQLCVSAMKKPSQVISILFLSLLTIEYKFCIF